MSEATIILLLYWLGPFVLTLIIMKNDPEMPEIIGYSLFPVLNLLFIPLLIWEVISRSVKSKGTCTLGHNFQHKYDSEAAKWANGKMPLRVSMGGFDDYQCSKCSQTKTITWKAF